MWDFKLLLQDREGGTLPVIVANEQAQRLLKIDPDEYTDLFFCVLIYSIV